MTEPKQGEGKSWWMSLPGVLTGLAGLLTAIGSLIVALHQVGLIHSSPGPPLTTSREAPNVAVSSTSKNSDLEQQVDGIGVKIIDVRQRRINDRMFIELQYRITNGSDFIWHNSSSFVQLISDNVTLTPVWTSVTATSLSPNSRQDFLVRFASPAERAPITFRFGEEHHLDITVRATD